MTYGIIGTGGIGGFYGGILAKSGCDVHFLFHSEYEAAMEHGLIVNSCWGDFTINPINAYNSTSTMPKCDVVLVAIKTTAQNRLADMLKPILKPDSTVVLIQNGLNMEKNLAALLPESVAIAGGMAYICVSRIAPAVIHHQDLGELTIGMHRGSDEKAKELCRQLKCGGVKVAEICSDLNAHRWKKLLWNIPYNGLTVILKSTTDRLMNNEASAKLIYDIMLEIISGAKACGVEIPISIADNLVEMTRHMKPYKTSMRLDYDNKRPMEIEYMYSEPIKEADAHGFIMAKTQVLEQQLKFIQNGYL